MEAIIKSSNDLNRMIESEVELGADIIHPFMQALFVGDDEQSHAKCADIAILDDDQRKRPDYIVEKYNGYDIDHPTCIEEIKKSNASENILVMDFYHIALFSKLQIQNHNLKRFLCFQAIGRSVTFYIMQLKCSMISLTEATAVKIPKSRNDIQGIYAYLDDLYNLTMFHQSIERNDSEVPKTANTPI